MISCRVRLPGRSLIMPVLVNTLQVNLTRSQLFEWSNCQDNQLLKSTIVEAAAGPRRPRPPVVVLSKHYPQWESHYSASTLFLKSFMSARLSVRTCACCFCKGEHWQFVSPPPLEWSGGDGEPIKLHMWRSGSELFSPPRRERQRDWQRVRERLPAHGLCLYATSCHCCATAAQWKMTHTEHSVGFHKKHQYAKKFPTWTDRRAGFLLSCKAQNKSIWLCLCMFIHKVKDVCFCFVQHHRHRKEPQNPGPLALMTSFTLEKRQTNRQIGGKKERKNQFYSRSTSQWQSGAFDNWKSSSHLRLWTICSCVPPSAQDTIRSTCQTETFLHVPLRPSSSAPLWLTALHWLHLILHWPVSLPVSSGWHRSGMEFSEPTVWWNYVPEVKYGPIWSQS